MKPGDNCALGDVGAQVLTRVPAARTLERVIVPRNGLSRHGVEALVNAELPRVHTLDVAGVAVDAATIEVLQQRRGVKALKKLVLNDESAVPTGGVETWYDQGAVVGSSAEVLRLHEVKQRYFAQDAVTLTSDEGPWPHSWLG